MTSKVAIMQPYIFPYLGYLSLVLEVDHFVFYDDVNFIKNGWINRNNLLLSGKAVRFTVPVVRASQNELIKDTFIHDLDAFRKKFVSQLTHGYSKAPFFQSTMYFVEETLNFESKNISDLASRSVINFFSHIGIKKSFLYSSTDFHESSGLSKEDRLISITKSLGSHRYINAIGGKSLYSKEYFSGRGVKLNFLLPKIAPYQQLKVSDFQGGLSIIDVMMNTPQQKILEHLKRYEIV